MVNFVYSIPTKIYFGEGEIKHLPQAIAPYGTKVLLVYGGGSIKKIGLYDKVHELLEDAGMTVVDLGGVEPNPRTETVDKGAKLCREHQIDVVLPVGGGSSIDCAKVIAAAAFYDGPAWDLMIGKAEVTKVLPIISVLTLSATGSEMDRNAVISNMNTNDKLAIAHEDMRPKVSILDPTYTYSVSSYQTAAGTADIMSHILEVYFSKITDGYLQDRMAEAMLKTCIHYGPIAMEQPDNYEARANLMWTSSWAINDMISLGKGCSWTVHTLEHELSAVYDITHGVGLAILTPAWMEYVLDDTTVDKFAEYAVNVWDIDKSLPKMEAAKAGIKATRDFFVNELKIAPRLSDIGIDDSHIDMWAEKLEHAFDNAYVKLSKEDIRAIYRSCL